MVLNNIYKCPNKKCEGKIKIKYNFESLNIKNINFNCTTNTYSKPKIFYCEKCEIMFSELIYNFDKKQIENRYENVEDQKYISQIKYKKFYFQKFFNNISNQIDINANVLEIGSYYGILGSIINTKVKKYSGLELSKHGANFSKKKFNLKIFNESIQQHMRRKIKYDVIIMADVIEHFKDPYEVFSQVYRLLNKKGKLILSTFNMDSMYAKLTGKNYHWIIPFHLVYFSNKTLRDFGKNNKLELYKIQNDPRYVSFGYLLEKLKLIFPLGGKIFQFLNKFKFLRNLTVKVNLGDLNIYYFIKSD